jgi:hypothetical protein
MGWDGGVESPGLSIEGRDPPRNAGVKSTMALSHRWHRWIALRPPEIPTSIWSAPTVDIETNLSLDILL